MILRARVLLPVAGPVVTDGAVEIRGNRVVWAGRWRDLVPGGPGPVEDLGESILMPGLVNAHCHLDFTAMRSLITPPALFTDWIRRINSLKAAFDTEDRVRSVRAGFAEAARFGTTTVLNIESFPELLIALGRPPIRTWWFYEMIDLRPRMQAEESMFGALRFFDPVPEGHPGGFGLSPHAPYTASAPLFRLARRCATVCGLPFTTHVAESREEFDMFRHGRGALYEFLRSIGRPMADCGTATPLAHLVRNDALPPGAILAHLNELGPGDLELLRVPEGSRPFTVVHCPGSHRYFGHSRFPWVRLEGAGVNLALGTDSLASNRSLSLFREMRLLAESEPGLDPARIVEMATRNGGRALGLDGRLGVIAPGAYADLISIPYAGKETGVFEAILGHRSPVSWMLLDGIPQDCSVPL